MRLPDFSSKKFIVLIVILIAAGGAVTYGYLNRGKLSHVNRVVKKTPTVEIVANTHTYSYRNLETYNFDTASAGLGASFQKPVEFKVYGTAGKAQVMLIQQAENNTVPDIGRIALDEIVYSSTFNAGNAADFSKAATDTNAPGYIDQINNLKDITNQWLPYRYSAIDLSTPKSFSSTNIGSNAWESDFKASSSGPNQPNLQGQILTIYGKNALYYFVVENVASDWQANQAAWQQVTGSLKVDQ